MSYVHFAGVFLSHKQQHESCLTREECDSFVASSARFSGLSLGTHRGPNRPDFVVNYSKFFCVLFRLTRLVRLRMNHSLAFLLVYDKAKIDDSLLNRDEAQLECSTMNRVSTYAVIVRAELLSKLIAILPTPLAFSQPK